MEQTCDVLTPATSVAKGFPDPARDLALSDSPNELVLGGGCFWCTEAVYAQLNGVTAVESGYAGGSCDTADYESVCSGNTDHAEVIRIRFDPSRLSYGQLLKVFFSVAHDPTQLNRQGADRGRQYRSVIFYGSQAEREVAEAYIHQLDAAKVFASPIVTELSPLKEFFIAETYHQDYAARNPLQPYIAAVAAPKVEKLKHYFTDQLKS